MGAMKGWAMASEELNAARLHWEQCKHSRDTAIRNETDAWVGLQCAKQALEPYLPTVQKAPEASQDAPGTPTVEVYAYCAECGRPVPESECDGDAPFLHVDCEAEYRQGRREAQADAAADALMFGDGKGTW